MSDLNRAPGTGVRRGRHRGASSSLVDPRAWFHLVRLVHYFNDTHVRQVRKLKRGQGVRISPNVSFVHGERVSIGDWSRIGARSIVWAGPRTGTIAIGASTTLGPNVLLTAANYGFEAGRRILDQEQSEGHIVIGDDVWLGAGVTVLPGVTIANGCVVGAGAVVTRDLPPGSVAVGVPARVVSTRSGGSGAS